MSEINEVIVLLIYRETIFHLNTIFKMEIHQNSSTVRRLRVTLSRISIMRTKVLNQHSCNFGNI